MSKNFGTMRATAGMAALLTVALGAGLFCGLVWAFWPQTNHARVEVRLIQERTSPYPQEAAEQALSYTQQLTDILARHQPEGDAGISSHLRQSPLAGVFWLDVEGRGDRDRLAAAATCWRDDGIVAIETARAQALAEVPDALRARVAKRMFSATSSGQLRETSLDPPWAALLVFGLAAMYFWTKRERHG